MPLSPVCTGRDPKLANALGSPARLLRSGIWGRASHTQIPIWVLWLPTICWFQVWRDPCWVPATGLREPPPVGSSGLRAPIYLREFGMPAIDDHASSLLPSPSLARPRGGNRSPQVLRILTMFRPALPPWEPTALSAVLRLLSTIRVRPVAPHREPTVPQGGPWALPLPHGTSRAEPLPSHCTLWGGGAPPPRS